MGLSVADMAARLRLHPRQVSAIEEEQLAALPEAPFVRGFVRNYAKELQLDPAPLLADLATRLPTAASLGDPLVNTGISHDAVRRAGVDGSSRVTVVGGALVVLIVLGLIGWAASLRSPTADSTVASPSLPAVDAGPAGATTTGATTVADKDAVVGPQPSPASVAVAVDTAPATMDNAASPASSSTTAAAVTSAPVLNGVRLRIGDRPSWIEISQADGAVILSGLQEPGTERRLAPVQPPLRLVIGNSSSVRLEYRGKPIDLKSYARADDLARLTLE
jgi:cytoskeleton protein RodZ